MLAFLRKRAQSLVIQAIVVIIALVFIFWGVGTNMMNKQEVAIVVNGEEISFQQYQQAYDQAYARLAQQFGGTVPKELVDTLDIRQQVINQLIQETLLRQGGLAMGLTVSGVEVQREVETMVQFQSNGGFDLQRYQAILAANRLSPSKYEDSLRHDLLSTKTIGALSAFVTTVSDAEIDDLYNLENETVATDYTILSPETYAAHVEVTAEALEQWFESAGEHYKTEEMVRLIYLPFSFQDTAEKISLEDEEISSYYEQHQGQFRVPESRQARHILLKADPADAEEIHRQQRRIAEEVLEKARNGEDFVTLARDYSEGPAAVDGGDLGFFSRGQMVKPFDDAVFAMQAGEISDIVQTDFGYHIIKLEEIRPAAIRSLTETRDEIADKLRLEQAKSLTFQVAGEAYEQIIGAGSLAAFLKDHAEATAITTDFFSRSTPPAGMAADQKFLDVAFTLKEGELSSLTQVADGYAIIAIDARREPAIPDLNQVREQAEEDFRREQAVAKARSVGEQLIEKLNNGASFEAIAGEHGLTVNHSGPLQKNAAGDQSSFPQPLVREAFRLAAAAPVVEEPALVGENYYVFRFVERKPPETGINDEDRRRYRELLLDYKRQQLVDAWLRNRQEQAAVSIHRSLQRS